jgi:NDP-sugar pyrophosphorylase family protein
MIFAAGLGTRLRPLTDDRPKALVQVGDKTLLEIALMRMKDFGIHDVIVNVHHFADMMIEYLKAHDDFGMNVAISREDVLLDTGGGLKKAGWFFAEDAEPFVVHNVDVISTIDLGQMVSAHQQGKDLATLAVKERSTSRYLIFDENLLLCGRRIVKDQKVEIVRAAEETQELAFSGIQIVSPRIIPMLSGEGSFSIINSYLELSGRGERIRGFRADRYDWRDVGTVDSLRKAATGHLQDAGSD